MDASLSGGLIVATEAMAESADEGDHLSDVTGPHKPLLSVNEQIAHLKRKGVSFELCGEDTARQVLSESSYFFRLAAYRVLFPKRVGGQHDGEYAGLDFGHLVDLAEIDRELRGLLLPMSLAVENDDFLCRVFDNWLK